MVIYKVVGITRPVDWATSTENVDLGLFQSRKGAQKFIDKMKSNKDFHMDWEFLRIYLVEVSP